MIDLHTNIFIRAARQDVFDAVSDHVSFLVGGQVSSVRLVTTGSDDINGLGCVREVTSMGIKIREEVTFFEPPHRFDYVIRNASVPMKHNGGSMVLTEHGDGTEVHWNTEFGIPIPLVGRGLGAISKLLLLGEFNRALMTVKRRLEA